MVCITLTLHALTTESDVKRHGKGANLVAITGEAPFLRINSPVSSSDLPNPYAETESLSVLLSLLVKSYYTRHAYIPVAYLLSLEVLRNHQYIYVSDMSPGKSKCFTFCSVDETNAAVNEGIKSCPDVPQQLFLIRISRPTDECFKLQRCDMELKRSMEAQQKLPVLCRPIVVISVVTPVP